jgi:hypothetical protein
VTDQSEALPSTQLERDIANGPELVLAQGRLILLRRAAGQGKRIEGGPGISQPIPQGALQRPAKLLADTLDVDQNFIIQITHLTENFWFNAKNKPDTKYYNNLVVGALTTND